MKPILFTPVESPYLVPFDGTFAIASASTEPPDGAPKKKVNEEALEESQRKAATQVIKVLTGQEPDYQVN